MKVIHAFITNRDGSLRFYYPDSVAQDSSMQALVDFTLSSESASGGIVTMTPVDQPRFYFALHQKTGSRGAGDRAGLMAFKASDADGKPTQAEQPDLAAAEAILKDLLALSRIAAFTFDGNDRRNVRKTMHERCAAETPEQVALASAVICEMDHMLNTMTEQQLRAQLEEDQRQQQQQRDDDEG